MRPISAGADARWSASAGWPGRGRCRRIRRSTGRPAPAGRVRRPRLQRAHRGLVVEPTSAVGRSRQVEQLARRPVAVFGGRLAGADQGRGRQHADVGQRRRRARPAGRRWPASRAGRHDADAPVAEPDEVGGDAAGAGGVGGRDGDDVARAAGCAGRPRRTGSLARVSATRSLAGFGRQDHDGAADAGAGRQVGRTAGVLRGLARVEDQARGRAASRVSAIEETISPK